MLNERNGTVDKKPPPTSTPVRERNFEVIMASTFNFIRIQLVVLYAAGHVSLTNYYMTSEFIRGKLHFKCNNASTLEHSIKHKKHFFNLYTTK